jgi:hypothetical protein
MEAGPKICSCAYIETSRRCVVSRGEDLGYHARSKPMQTEFSDVMRSVCVNHVALASPLPVVALSMEWSWLGARVWCFKLEHPYAPFAQTSDGISYRDCAIPFDMLRNHPILRFHCQLRCEKPRWSAWQCW